MNLFLLFLLLNLNISCDLAVDSSPLHAVEIAELSEINDSNPWDRERKARQKRHEIAKFALNFRGKKYGYGSSGPNKFDCSGFTSFIFHHYNVNLKRSSGLQSKQGKSKKIGKLQPADLVFFGTGSRVNHVGFVLEASKDKLIIIHSTSSRGVIVEDVYKSKYWTSRLKFGREVLEF